VEVAVLINLHFRRQNVAKHSYNYIEVILIGQQPHLE